MEEIREEKTCDCSLSAPLDIKCSEQDSYLRNQNMENVNAMFFDENGNEITMDKKLYRFDLEGGKLKISLK